MKESLSARPIQWFPGHMTKTLRLMEKDIRNVDAVLQLLDARIPRSSLNPEIARITAGKPHLYVLNKADLADPDVTARWVAYFRRGGDDPVRLRRRGDKFHKNAHSGITPICRQLSMLILLYRQPPTGRGAVRILRQENKRGVRAGDPS